MRKSWGRVSQYLENVTGIGIVDFYRDNPLDHTVSPAACSAGREATLRAWMAAAKLELTVDYMAKSERIVDAYRRP